MAASSTAPKTVLIDESYFQLLLRKADHASKAEINEICIPKDVHDELVKDSRAYHCLRRALILGGATAETVDLLAQGSPPIVEYDESNGSELYQKGSWFEKPVSHPVRFSKADATGESKGLNVRTGKEPFKHFHPHDDQDSNLHAAEDDFLADYDAAWTEIEPEKHQRKEARNDHTLLLSNLPADVTHREITSLLRGGRIIDLWLRRGACSVTFAEGAADYLHWVKRNDIYVRGKRVGVSWSERQFQIPRHLLSKLANGHSRNLVIRGALGKLTEDKIREDMEHIHNLVLVAFVWQGYDVYVSTNSLDKATFARNCMMSRIPYKGLKIDWYADECAIPIPEGPARSGRLEPAISGKLPQQPAARAAPVKNRFEMLSMDDGEDSPSSADSNKTSMPDQQSQVSDFMVARRSVASDVDL